MVVPVFVALFAENKQVTGNLWTSVVDLLQVSPM
jgi:hypothetical protein